MIRVGSASRRAKKRIVTARKNIARPTARTRLRTSARRSSSSTLMSLQLVALQSGQLPTQLISFVNNR